MSATNKNNTQNDGALDNAGEIIERFGGIRPMSKKIDVAVTTIQGWKKRDVIPAARRDDILKAAARYDVDLSDIANENGGKRESDAVVSTEKQSAPETIVLSARVGDSSVGKFPSVEDEFENEIHQKIIREIRMSETVSVRKSMWVSSALILVASVGVIMLLFPQNKKINENESRIAYVEKQIRENGGGESLFANMIPESLQNQIGELQQQARAIQGRVASISQQAEDVSRVLTSPNEGNLATRIERLEKQLSTIASDVGVGMGMGGNMDLSMWLQKIETMQNSDIGRAVLNNSVVDMKQIMAAMGMGAVDEVAASETGVDQALETAQQDDDALGEVLEGLSGDDLKAAAMLLGLTQFRNAVNREDGFADDLTLMQSMLGTTDNEALNEALVKLAPHAADGVLSPQRLGEEFKGLAGDIVVSSLKGEDVSVQEKAKARLNEILEIKKDGELITGTDTQARVARAQTMLDEGNVEGAIKELQSLEGEAAGTAKPWIEEAQASLLARDAEGMITGEVISKLKEMSASAGSMASGGVSVKGSYNNVINKLKEYTPNYKMYRDSESGFGILVPEMQLPTGKKNSVTTGR